MQAREAVTAGGSIRDGLRSLLRPPHRNLLLLSVIVSITSARIGLDRAAPDQTELLLSLGLFVVSLYVEIAVTLAAGRYEADPSADMWVKAAWRRKVFWRYLFASIVAVAALMVGALAFVVGLFVAGAIVGLIGPAVVLERRTPIPAAFRSAQLTKGSRVPVGIVVAVLFVLPTLGVQVAFISELDRTLGAAWIALTVVAEILRLGGVIAVTRMFVQLGGSPTPHPEQMAPPPPVQIPR